MQSIGFGFLSLVAVAGLALLALLIVVGLPLLLIWLLVRPRGSTPDMTAAELETLARMQQGLGRMEQRIANLETILADEPPPAATAHAANLPPGDHS